MLFGEMEIDVDCGAVFDTEMLVLAVAISPCASVTVAVQVMVSVSLTMSGVSCQVDELLLEPLRDVQA